jgi:TRAP-type uncharacterized transport system fused permease subunit
MTEHQAERAQLSTDIDAAALQKAEEYIEQEEGAANKFRGALAVFVTPGGGGDVGFHLYTAYAIVPTQTLRRCTCLRAVSLLPGVPGRAALSPPRDVVGLARGAAGGRVRSPMPCLGGDDFTDRNTSPLPWDIFFGVALILLILEAMRRTAGWIMPVICLAFLAYALFGPYLPRPGPTRATTWAAWSA